MLLQKLLPNHGLRLGTLLERAAARWPANLVVLDHHLDVAPELGTRVTVTELADLVAEQAGRLRAAGVRIGDYVVLHKADGFDVTLLACAISRVGAVPVLLSPHLTPDVVATLVRRVGDPYLLTDPGTLDRLPAEVFDDARAVLVVGGPHDRAVALSDLAGSPRGRAVGVPVDRPALVTHTSGTTGIPKLAVHTGRTLQSRYWPQIAAVSALARRREGVAIHVSFVHSRLMTALAMSLLRGCPLAILRGTDLEHTAQVLGGFRPGIVEAHPNTFMEWEPLAEDPRRPLANVTLFSSTFDALHPRTVRRMFAATDRRRPAFVQLYGQSEVGPITIRTYTPQRGVTDGRCVGRAFPGLTSTRVVSRDGRPVSPTSPGFIEVRTAGRIVDCLGETDRYRAQARDGGWWRMGDVGHRSRSGRVHLLDREVDLIDGIGSTLAVEDALFDRVDSLLEVILVPDEDGGAVPVVCTRDDAPLDRVAWDAAVRDLPPLAPPVQLDRDAMPYTATMKVKRLQLARELAGGAPARSA